MGRASVRLLQRLCEAVQWYLLTSLVTLHVDRFFFCSLGNRAYCTDSPVLHVVDHGVFPALSGRGRCGARFGGPPTGVPRA